MNRDEPGSLENTAVGRYLLLQLVGRGAFAEVYRARDTNLDRDVAIKAFDPRFSATAELREMILQEARLHARLEHANIVRIYDMVDHDAQFFLVMRYLQGMSLFDLQHALGGKLELVEAARYMRQVLKGVGFAHSKGVIHGDLKPRNIQITPYGEALVMDFGIACMISDQGGDGDEVRKATAGSPPYMSPEQILGRYHDARSDLYALAVTMYELVTGRHPFEEAQSEEELLRCHVHKAPPLPSLVNSALPPSLDRVLLRALDKDPEKRFRSCTSFAEHLHAAMRRDGVEPITDEDEEDNRWHPRVEIALSSRVFVAGGMVFLNVLTHDLSVGGAAVWLDSRPEVGASVQIELDPPEGTGLETVRAEGLVVWASPERDGAGHQVGLRFVDIDDEDRRTIQVLVRNVLMLGEEGATGEWLYVTGEIRTEDLKPTGG